LVAQSAHVTRWSALNPPFFREIAGGTALAPAARVMNCRPFASLVGVAYVTCAAGCWSGNTTPPEQTPFYAPTYEPPTRGSGRTAGTDVATDSDATEPARPTKTTLRGAFSSLHVKHTRLDDDVKSTLTFAADVEASPALAYDDALDFFAADIETAISAPDAGTCEPELVLELDAGTLTGTFTGTDQLGTLDCSAWLDAITTDGFSLKLTNVPWRDAAADDPRVSVKLALTVAN